MNNIEFLYSFILCMLFAIANISKVGLKNKTYVLPSTFFSLMWALTSVGGLLYSNMLICSDNTYYAQATYLNEISSYQLVFLIVVLSSFVFARLINRKIQARPSFNTGKMEVAQVRHKMRWILYIFFLIGMYRLISVVAITGFDYAKMREFYVGGTFNEFELNLIRIASYLSQFTGFYICLLGMETAIRGVRIKLIIKDFLLFIPFHMSFGGRLFILSFFAPFIFSYLLTYSLLRKIVGNRILVNKGKFDKKFWFVLASPIIMLIIVQILKMGDVVNYKTIDEYSTEIFYTTSSYMHMNELWAGLPYHYDLGYGVNILGLGSDVYNKIIESWITEKNPALVCVPSIIPQAYLDFGKVGALLFFFVVFFFMENVALRRLKNVDNRSIYIIVLLCQIAYQTTSSSDFDCIRSLIVGYIALVIFDQMTTVKFDATMHVTGFENQNYKKE